MAAPGARAGPCSSLSRPRLFRGRALAPRRGRIRPPKGYAFAGGRPTLEETEESAERGASFARPDIAL
ncbi:hypothetical protein GCM10009548_19410 [Streptomyces malaysiensis subsp. malaysiensis]